MIMKPGKLSDCDCSVCSSCLNRARHKRSYEKHKEEAKQRNREYYNINKKVINHRRRHKYKTETTISKKDGSRLDQLAMEWLQKEGFR